MSTPGLPKIAIATGDPAGIGPEVSLKAALDAGVRALCRPIVVGDAGGDPPARGCGGARCAAARDRRSARGHLRGRRGRGARRAVRRQRGARVRRQRRGVWARHAGERRAGDRGGARRRGRRGGGGAAQPDLDRGGRNCVRRLPDLRGARDRHEPPRRVSHAVLRRHAHRPLHAACRRRAGARADHPRAGRPHDPRRRRGAAADRHRRSRASA